MFYLFGKIKFTPFERGFQLVTHNSPLTSLIRPEELESMVIGQREYDWAAFKEQFLFSKVIYYLIDY